MSQHLFDLKGKTFLVTGASSGIGYEVCKTIALMNGNFIAVARREELLESLLKEYGTKNSTYIAADLSTNKGIEKVVNAIDKIDGLVHSAGATELTPLRFYTTEKIDKLRIINYDSVLLLVNSIAKKKKINKFSSIVLISSLSSIIGSKGLGIYSGLKGALVSISRAWANEFSLYKTRVNCVSPGMVKTDISIQLEEHLSKEQALIDEAKYPLGYGEPEDVAYPVVFLLSDAAKWITGQNIILDGGRTSCID
jgi:NAD(P)-dependent dehydrogenase (short-subunit alcohol dehydrogenase family)